MSSHHPRHSLEHVVFAGGGTGGHLMPGLAVAEQLHRQWPGARLTFAGDGKLWQRDLVRAADCEYLDLPCHPLPRRLADAVRFARGEMAGYRTARAFLRRHRPEVVVGLGGFASVPMALAAARAGVPLVLLEQNAVPGKATRWLSRWARAVCLSFPEAADRLPRGCPIHVTGNPVRRAFFAGSRVAGTTADLQGATGSSLSRGATGILPVPCLAEASLPGVPAASQPSSTTSPDPGSLNQLLVLGGSGGAEALNRAMPEALARLSRAGVSLDDWRIVHQSGEEHVDATARRYALAGLSARVVGWIGEMPAAMHCSALAVCRAGGTTLAELAAARLPAVLVPYPHAADDHQRANARALAARHPAVVVDQVLPPVGRDDARGRLADASFEHRLASALVSAMSGSGGPLSPPAGPTPASEVPAPPANPSAATEVVELLLGAAASAASRAKTPRAG